MIHYTENESILELRSAVTAEEIQAAMSQNKDLPWLAQRRESTLQCLERLQSLCSKKDPFYIVTLSRLQWLDEIVRSPASFRDVPASDFAQGEASLTQLRLEIEARLRSEEFPCSVLANVKSQT